MTAVFGITMNTPDVIDTVDQLLIWEYNVPARPLDSLKVKIPLQR